MLIEKAIAFDTKPSIFSIISIPILYLNKVEENQV